MFDKTRLPVEPQAPVVEVSADAAIIELQTAIKEMQSTIKGLFEQMRRAGIAK